MRSRLGTQRVIPKARRDLPLEKVIEKVPISSPGKRKKKAPVPKEKPKPSRYMQEIIRLNFVTLVDKVKGSQTKNRIAALRTMRRHLAKNFMKLYRAFREKKYGEIHEGEYVWPKDTPKKKKKHPLLGGL